MDQKKDQLVDNNDIMTQPGRKIGGSELILYILRFTMRTIRLDLKLFDVVLVIKKKILV